MAPWIRAQIGGIDPTVPVDVETLNERVSRLADRPRFETALLGFFAISGTVDGGDRALRGDRVYGGAAHAGDRGADGAGRGPERYCAAHSIEGLRLVAAGGVAGLAAALALSRLLRSLLFHVGPYDPVSYGAVVILLGVVALAATLLPARAAMKTDPMAALRVE